MMLRASVAAILLVLILAPVSAIADGPSDGFQRFRFPWPSNGTYLVFQSVESDPTHQSSTANKYAIDWPLAYNTFVAASGQGQVVFVDANPMSSVGYGAHVIQAVTIPGPPEETKYILYAHLCFAGATVGQALYQGEYVGRSGNSGFVLPTPSARCSTQDSTGMHLHFMFSNGTPPSTTNPYQFGVVAESKVSNHKASKATGNGNLPLNHNTTSNNAGPGFYSFTGTSGQSPMVDPWVHDRYVALGGLNYGSTREHSSSTHTPCATVTRWVHGCSLGSWGGGLAQTFMSLGSSPRALIRQSGVAAAYRIDGDMLYAFHFWNNSLGYPTGDRAAGSQYQYFQGGYIRQTTSPCETKVWSYALNQFVATYYVCLP